MKHDTFQTYRNALATMSHIELINYTADILVQLQRHGVVPSMDNPQRLDFTGVHKRELHGRKAKRSDRS